MPGTMPIPPGYEIVEEQREPAPDGKVHGRPEDSW